MKVLGLTGGIGMGKSNVALALKRLRIPVFDADATVHRLQAKGGAAIAAIAAAFPGTVVDGVLDRAALRARVLADRAALRRLEGILHPLVRRAQARFIAGCRRRGVAFCVLDIPLLFETGGHRRVDHVLLVTAPPSIQFHRVRLRGTMDAAQIRRVIALQHPDAAKRRGAQTLLHTGLSRAHTLAQLKGFLRVAAGGALPRPHPRHRRGLRKVIRT